jgi:hypothetical protein
MLTIAPIELDRLIEIFNCWMDINYGTIGTIEVAASLSFSIKKKILGITNKFQGQIKKKSLQCPDSMDFCFLHW